MSAPPPMEGRGHVTGPKVQILTCEPYRQGPAARHRLIIAIGSFQFSGIIVYEQAGEQWITLPTRPRLRDGKAQPRKGGGIISDPVIEIANEQSRRRFDSAVLAALGKYQADAGRRYE